MSRTKEKKNHLPEEVAGSRPTLGGFSRNKIRKNLPHCLESIHLDALVTTGLIADLTGIVNVEAVGIPQFTDCVLSENKGLGVAFIHAFRKKLADVFSALSFRGGNCDLDTAQGNPGRCLKKFGVVHMTTSYEKIHSALAGETYVQEAD